MPLRHLIVLIANAHHLLDLEFHPPRLRSKGFQIDYPDKPEFAEPEDDYLLQPTIHDAIDVFDLITLLELRRAARLCQVLRPASRDMIRYRAVRQR